MMGAPLLGVSVLKFFYEKIFKNFVGGFSIAAHHALRSTMDGNRNY